MNSIGLVIFPIYFSLSQSSRNISFFKSHNLLKNGNSKSAIVEMLVKVFSMITPLIHSFYCSASLAQVWMPTAPPRDLPSKNTFSLFMRGSVLAYSSTASVSRIMPYCVGWPSDEEYPR